jgi:stage II sporulation protein AA (anti-sigma F factor antagonist)
VTELGQITISVNGSHDGGAGAEVSVAGDVDLETAPRLSDVLAEAIGSRSGDLTVDLAGVEFIDAAGIGVLVSAANQVRTGGARLVVRSPSPAVRRVLDAVELDGALPIEG